MTTDCTINIMVLGETDVGKTTLLVRYTKGMFRVPACSTSIDCLKKDISVLNMMVQLLLWDTAGQDRFRCIVRQYFRKAEGVLLIYDVTDMTSFLKLASWLKELREINETAVVVIVGNKTDLEDRKSVSRSTVKEFARQEDLDYFETSAKSGENLDKMFQHLALKILVAKQFLQAGSSLRTEIPYTSSVQSVNPNNSLGSGHSSTDSSFHINTLPPIVPFPDDTIKVHVDVSRTNDADRCMCEN